MESSKSLSCNLNKIFSKKYLIAQNIFIVLIIPITLVLKFISVSLAFIPILLLIINSIYIIMKIMKFYKN